MRRKNYGKKFYQDRHQKTVYSAQTVLSIVLEALPPPVHSAIDFGCGVGTWLSVLREKGVAEILGLDGAWVDRNFLEIPQEHFREVDFEKEIHSAKKYDLAMALEVAEHLSPTSAEHFVDSLANASDFVLFSAAIPFQGGKGHLNEQWPDYWRALFAQRGFIALDIVRKKIWEDKQIPTWYRQNILLFAREEQAHRIRRPDPYGDHNTFPISLVHPDTYLSKMNQASSIRGSLKCLRRAIRKHLRSLLGRSE